MRALLLCVMFAMLAAPALADLPPPPPKKEATTGTPTVEFQAADLSKHKEDLSGIPLMVGAYMVIWSGLFLYLFALQKRTNHTLNEVAELKRLVAAHEPRE